MGDKIFKCNNKGTITGKQVGGIYGGKTQNTTITDCVDNGKVNIINE